MTSNYLTVETVILRALANKGKIRGHFKWELEKLPCHLAQHMGTKQSNGDSVRPVTLFRQSHSLSGHEEVQQYHNGHHL